MDTATLLQAIYKAYRENRLADMMAYLDEDFCYVLHLPEEAVPGGDTPRDQAGTLEVLEYVHQTYEFLSFDPGPIIATDDRARVQPLVRLRDKRTGKVLETKLTHTWRVKDGKGLELDERHDLPKIEAFLKSVAESDT